MKLKRNFDRKVTNLPSPNGKAAKIANTLGLPSGTAFSCPMATSVCSKVCYAGRIEKMYKGSRAVVEHNWALVRDADRPTLVGLLTDMLNDFIVDCEKWDAPKSFRIHWDGDFFKVDYVEAWKEVILAHPQVQFWVYTRTPYAFEILDGIENLALYFSTDSENQGIAEGLRANAKTGRLAVLADTFADGEVVMRSITGKVGARCPENAKQIPLISTEGSACMSCGLCPKGQVDVRFSALKR
jgi:hypothetical protein